MRIEYKTEGKLELRDSTSLHEPAVVKWLRGSDSIGIYQGNNMIRLSKGQLTQLATMAATICDDIKPNMGSLPRGSAE